MAHDNSITCPPPTVLRVSDHNAEDLRRGHEFAIEGHHCQDRFKLFHLVFARVFAVFSAFNSVIVLLCLATMHTDRVAFLALAAAAAQVALRDGSSAVSPIPPAARALSHKTRVLLQSGLAAWDVLFCMNAVIFFIAVSLLQMPLPRVDADPMTHGLLMLVFINSFNDFWVTSCYYHSARRVLEASCDHTMTLRWAMNFARFRSRTYFHPAAVLAVPAATSAWSIVSVLASVILISSPYSLVHLIPSAMQLDRYEFAAPIIASAYAVLSIGYNVAAAHAFVSLGVNERTVEDAELEDVTTSCLRSVAEPVCMVAEHVRIVAEPARFVAEIC